jgi:hypothetical protein
VQKCRGNGATDLLLAQQVYEWGYRAVDLLFDAVENPFAAVVRMTLQPSRRTLGKATERHTSIPLAITGRLAGPGIRAPR